MSFNPRHGLRPKKHKETKVELKRRLAKEVTARKKARRLKRMLSDLEFDFETKTANKRIQILLDKGNPKVIDPDELAIRRAANRKRTFKT